MGSSGGSSEHFLRQLSSSDGGGGGAPHQLLQQDWECGGTGTGSGRRGSRRWSTRKKARARGHRRGAGFCRTAEEAAAAGRKRVIVVVDESSGAKHAMMWALTHVASKGDFLTLLHVLQPQSGAGAGRGGGVDASVLANSLGALCKACRPEVEVEALVIQGPKLSTVLSQVKKLEASVLVLSQRKPSPFCCFMRSSGEAFVEECIARAECLTLAVRRQSKGVGGYLVSTRWQKDFWLLA